MPRSPARPPRLDLVRRELDAIADAGLQRRMPQITGAQAIEISVDGQRAINFCSNNYLGLANHPALIAAAEAAMRSDGFGAGASRLIVGNLAPHRALEERIARWKRTEAALLFNSGYQANVGLVSALVGPGDIVYSDELNHASLIDGARLSRATVRVYPHRDTEALAALLATDRAARRRLILTESLFSMDGDAAPLPDVVALASEHDALVLVDEAHAAGALGTEGRGLAEGLDIDLQMGTLGKAAGAFGAYVAGSRELIELVLNRARSVIFTTALPVPVVAAAHAAIDLIASGEGDDRRRRLAENRDLLFHGLRALGLARPDATPSHILPVVVGDPARTMALSRWLLERGLHVQGIRPPTVPDRSSRLRITVSAEHQPAHIEALLEALAARRDELSPP